MNNEKASNKKVQVGPAFLKIAGSDMHGTHRGQEWEREQCYGGGTASRTFKEYALQATLYITVKK